MHEVWKTINAFKAFAMIMIFQLFFALFLIKRKRPFKVNVQDVQVLF